MKKLVIILVVVLALAAGLLSWRAIQNKSAEVPDAEPTEPAAETDNTALDAIYATHAGDEVVMTLKDREITWDEYFGWFNYNAKQLEAYAANYGAVIDWSAPVSDDADTTYLDYVAQVTESTLVQYIGMEFFAAENGVTANDEINAEMEEYIANDKAQLCGEDATDEEFAQLLKDSYSLNSDVYREMVYATVLNNSCIEKLYGAENELVSADDVLSYMNDCGYMRANHILFLNKNAESGEALDEAGLAEQRAKAQTVLDELLAIEDNEALAARFAELKQELDEDGGKTAYPNGYTFSSGEMVAPFEEAVIALEDYGLSDIVETDYGYHVILRLPLDPDEIIMSQSASGRTVYVSQDYSARMTAFFDALSLEYAEGFTAPSAADLAE